MRSTYHDPTLGEELADWWNNNRKKIIGGVAGALGALYLISAYKPVDQKELGVVTTLGQYTRTARPGPNFIVPVVQRMHKEDVQTTRKVEIGFRTLPAKKGEKPQYRDALTDDEMRTEAQMLTADENIIWASMVIQYRVRPSGVEDYKFNLEDPHRALNEVGRATLAQNVGDYGVDEILTFARAEIEQSIKEDTQSIMDLYDSGIEVIAVQLQQTQPPNLKGTDKEVTVAEAFQDVESARQHKEELVQQGQSYAYDVVESARGEAAKKISDAQGDKATRVGDAQADVSEFNDLYTEFQENPEGTRYRLYVETMQETYPELEKIVVDDELLKRGMVPIFDLEGRVENGN